MEKIQMTEKGLLTFNYPNTQVNDQFITLSTDYMEDDFFNLIEEFDSFSKTIKNCEWKIKELEVGYKLCPVISESDKYLLEVGFVVGYLVEVLLKILKFFKSNDVCWSVGILKFEGSSIEIGTDTVKIVYNI